MSVEWIKGREKGKNETTSTKEARSRENSSKQRERRGSKQSNKRDGKQDGRESKPSQKGREREEVQTKMRQRTQLRQTEALHPTPIIKTRRTPTTLGTLSFQSSFPSSEPS